MAKGKAKVIHLHRSGLVGLSDVSDWDFLYETSLVRDPRFNVGDRVVLGDGRVFRFGNAGNIVLKVDVGLKFWDELGDGVAYTALLQGQDVGDRTIHIDAGAAAAVTKDQLRGGYVIFHVGYTTAVRGIIGNTLADSDGHTTLTLDAPFQIALTTADRVEVCTNPYGNLHYSGAGGDSYSSVAGVPNVTTAAALQYLWIQTWGPCFIAPQSPLGATVTAFVRQCTFRPDGAIDIHDDDEAYNEYQQHAGFVIQRESVGNGTSSPLIMLQISP